MSDFKLRDLERRWKETGTVEDEAAYLLERVRVGDLSRERLELAGHLGHDAAELAIGRGAEPLAVDGTWFLRLTPWSPPLAVWALAEACTVEPRLGCERLLDDVRFGLRAAFVTGTADEFVRSLPAERLRPLSSTACGKSLVIWFNRLRQDGRRVHADDPDVLRAIEDVRSRFRSLDASDLTYAWSERGHDGSWVHRLRHNFVGRSGVEGMARVVASPRWEPGSDAVPADPRFLGDLIFFFSDPERAKAAVRHALLPWALAPHGSST